MRAPSVVPKLSLGAGLVYTYTKPKRNDTIDAWYLTALDFDTGKTVYSRLAGTGFGYNNNFAPVTIAPNGTAYVGVLGGLTQVQGRARLDQRPQLLERGVESGGELADAGHGGGVRAEAEAHPPRKRDG